MKKFFLKKKKAEELKKDFKAKNEFFEDIINWSKNIQKVLGLDQEDDPQKSFENLKNMVKYETGTIASNREQFLQDWKATDNMPTEKIVKNIYQDSYSSFLAKFKNSTNYAENSLNDEDKRRKTPKKFKIAL